MYADAFAPQSSLDLASNLITTRLQKLADARDFALKEIADSGVFDSVSNRFKNTGRPAFSVTSAAAEFDEQASRISATSIASSTTSAKASTSCCAMRRPTQDASTVSGVVNTMGNAFDRLAKASDSNPRPVQDISSAVTTLSGKIGGFIDAVLSIAHAANNPSGFASNVSNSPGFGTTAAQATLGYAAAGLPGMCFAVDGQQRKSHIAIWRCSTARAPSAFKALASWSRRRGVGPHARRWAAVLISNPELATLLGGRVGGAG